MSIAADNYIVKSLTSLNSRIFDLKKGIDSFARSELQESKRLILRQERDNLLQKYLDKIKTEKKQQTVPKVTRITPDEFGISKITPTEIPQEPKQEPKQEEKPLPTQRTGEGIAAVSTFGMVGKYSSGLYIGATGDRDGQQTGLDMNLPGGIGTPIYAPIDMIYRVKGNDGLPSVGLQGTPDVKGPNGRGFGYYGAYYFVKDGKTYEVLLGHLASMGYTGTVDNQIIPAGTLLGYQGASGRTIGEGNQPYPHISLHVNGVGFTASNSVLTWFANLLANYKGSKVEPPKSKTQPPPKSQQLSSASKNNIVALVSSPTPQAPNQQPKNTRSSSSSLNRNYGSFNDVLLAHTTFNVG
jgi:hypothetical protein